MTATARRLDLDALAELEEQREFLLRSIADLDRERAAGDIDEIDHRTLRDDYTRRAAEVLRAIEEDHAVRAAARPEPRPARRLAVAAAVVAVAVVAGLAVAASSGSRLPGDTLTGGAVETASGQLAQAARLAGEGRFTDALRLYDEVLTADPENVEALSERGLLLVSLARATDRPALAAEGRRSVEAAIDLEPGNARALFYLGLALRLEGRDAEASDALERALAADPSPALRRQIEQFRETAGSS